MIIQKVSAAIADSDRMMKIEYFKPCKNLYFSRRTFRNSRQLTVKAESHALLFLPSI